MERDGVDGRELGDTGRNVALECNDPGVGVMGRWTGACVDLLAGNAWD